MPPMLGRKLAEAKPQAVIMYLSGKQPADLMPAMRAADSNPMFYGMSIVSGEVVAKALGEQSRGLAIAQVMPYPWSQSDTDIGAYQKAVAAAKLEPNYYSLEGWINAQVTIEALKRTGRELTRGRLLATRCARLKMRIAGFDLDFTSRESSPHRASSSWCRCATTAASCAEPPASTRSHAGRAQGGPYDRAP